MALSPEVSIGYSIISMRMEPIKAFHVSHTIGFCRYRKAMVNLCQEANSHTIEFSQRRKAMVNLCQEANSHTIGFSQRRKAMVNLCQEANSHTIGFSQRLKAMDNLCQEASIPLRTGGSPPPPAAVAATSTPSNSHTHARNAPPGTRLQAPPAAHSASTARLPHNTAAASPQ